MSTPAELLHELSHALDQASLPLSDAEKNICLICLRKNGEAPPVCGFNESKTLVKVCNCGARSHRKCFIDWALESGTRRHGDRRISNSFRFQETLYFSAEILHYGPAVVGLRSKDPQKEIYTGGPDVDCPECGRSIVLLIKPSKLMSLYNFVHSKLLLFREFIPITAQITLAYFTFKNLKRVGAYMLGFMANASTLSEILGIPTGEIQSLIPNTLARLIPQIHLSTLPLVFYSMRLDSRSISVGSYISSAISILTAPSRPISYALTLLKVVDFVYDGIKRIILGQYYYRSFLKIPPGMLSFTCSDEEIHILAHEAQRVEALEEYLAETVANESNWLWKFTVWLYPSYSQEQLDSLVREDKIVLQNDYPSLIHEELDHYYYWSFFWKAGTTILWPVAGSFVGGLLGQYTPIDNLLLFVGTEGEISYARNIIGSAIVAIGRDFFRLFLAWRAFRHYDLDIEVVTTSDDLLEPAVIYYNSEIPPALDNDQKSLMIAPPLPFPMYQTSLGEQSYGAFLLGEVAWRMIPRNGDLEKMITRCLQMWTRRQV